MLRAQLPTIASPCRHCHARCADRQLAHFGSTGGDFALVKRLR